MRFLSAPVRMTMNQARDFFQDVELDQTKIPRKIIVSPKKPVRCSTNDLFELLVTVIVKR